MIRRILLVVALVTPAAVVLNTHAAEAGDCPEVLPQFSVNDVTVGEGGGSATFTVSVDREPTAGCPASASYSTMDGSATAGDDYTASNGEVEITNGEGTSTTVDVPIIDDDSVEESETFTLTLSSPEGATIADGEGVGTITDNDEPQATTTSTSTSTTTTTAPPTGTVSDDNPSPGDDVDITATGFGPNTQSQIFFLSEPILLTTATAGSDGVVRASITIPDDAQPGSHTIEVRGVDSNETPRTVSIPITVAGEVTGTTAAAQPLAATGSGLSTLIIVAGVLAAAGGALLLEVRRRRTAGTV